jgi:hypothetical protein
MGAKIRITLFTGNQPRHLTMIEKLAEIAEQVFVVQGAETLFPGKMPGLFRKSDVMEAYFAHVRNAENTLFGGPRFSPANARMLVMRPSDVNELNLDQLGDAMRSDIFVVFGAAWIRGPLASFLVANKALNIHMGLSPWFRGSSCNFWALHDGRADLVGATIHYLSAGLDNGAILFHALPAADTTDPFLLGMRAVQAAQTSLVSALDTDTIQTMEPVEQNSADEIRYSRGVEFTDEVASDFLEDLPSPQDIGSILKTRNLTSLVRPFIA